MRIKFSYKTNFQHKWCGLDGSASAYALAQLYDQQPHSILYIADNAKQASQMLENLSFFGPNIPVFHFLDWELLPYEMMSPSVHIIAERLNVLHAMQTHKKYIVIAAAATCMHAICPPEFVSQHIWHIEKNQAIEIDALLAQLEKSGYYKVSQTSAPAEFSIRGEVLDLFPSHSKQAFRIKWDDDHIESIELLDVKTQQTTTAIDQINIMPTTEYPTSTSFINRAIAAYETHFPHASASLKNRLLVKKKYTALESYMPLFFNEKYGLIDHMPSQSIIACTDQIQHAIEKYWKKIQEQHHTHQHQAQQILAPSALFFNTADLFQKFKYYAQVQIKQTADAHTQDFKLHIPYAFFCNLHDPQHLEIFIEKIKTAGRIIVIAAKNKGRVHTLLKIFQNTKLQAHPINALDQATKKSGCVYVLQKKIIKSACLKTHWIIDEKELFHTQISALSNQEKASQQAQKIAKMNMIENLNQGDYVVYEKYGVGKFAGLMKVDAAKASEEMICIEYADQDKCYLSVEQIDQISPYQGAPPEKLNKMNEKTWKKNQKKTDQQAYDHAAKLLKIYAQRKSEKGHSFEFNAEKYLDFVQEFPYEETNDQLEAIGQIIADMQSENPMERLLCGDVGFGKTEIAMRATFIAASNKKQVILLAPTTLLVEQHLQNFQDRFSSTALKIMALSRFHELKKSTLEAIQNGTVDIIIGTHKILQKTIRFKNVGLLVIDEEQRFGVHQKEQIRAAFPQVDTLLMTATPIPRTLNFALNGLYDLSVITTPPKKRLPIQTHIISWDDELIKDAIEREIHRGGQVFLIEQRINHLNDLSKKIATLLPDVSVKFAHGQMPKDQLEEIMTQFYQQEIDVLVATTIIEIGIDIHNANTIIIHNAQRFGLAQLYQIRGRVGRSHHQAYAYLITPERKLLPANAKRRLDAMERAKQLGIGFCLATEDLEIRGGGDLLGDAQSGQNHKTNFHLYQATLKKAIASIAMGHNFEDVLEDVPENNLQIKLNKTLTIPEKYIHDPHDRLLVYRKIAQAQNAEEIRQIEEELINQFGSIPEPTNNLIAQAKLKQVMLQHHIYKILYLPTCIQITFGENANINTEKLIALIQSPKSLCKLSGNRRIEFGKITDELEHDIQNIKHLLHKIQPA